MTPGLSDTVAGAAASPDVTAAVTGAHARPASHVVRPSRDALVATVALVALIVIGSGGGAALDPALFGYLGATIVAAFAVAWRISAFYQRPAAALYVRALRSALAQPRHWPRLAASAGRDLAAQDFIRRRSTVRWLAHLALSLGTMVSFAITLPLVFGWMHFVPAGDRHYRLIVFTLPVVRFAVDRWFGWLLFHGLALAAIGVVLGVTYFLVLRWRIRHLPGAASGFAIAPLVLLLTVALSGLALPACRGWPAAVRTAAVLHELSVVILLLALPFSKLGHVLIRPLQLGVRALRAADPALRRCATCGAPIAPAVQHAAVAALLSARGVALDTQLERCAPCRRRQLARAQAALVGGHFQPCVTGGGRSEAVRPGRGTVALASLPARAR